MCREGRADQCALRHGRRRPPGQSVACVHLRLTQGGQPALHEPESAQPEGFTSQKLFRQVWGSPARSLGLQVSPRDERLGPSFSRLSALGQPSPQSEEVLPLVPPRCLLGDLLHSRCTPSRHWRSPVGRVEVETEVA